jgi:hypothetical protein
MYFNYYLVSTVYRYPTLISLATLFIKGQETITNLNEVFLKESIEYLIYIICIRKSQIFYYIR